ncbi:hypothetical protein [Kordiimonas sp.]|uniref:hypothetical protein n=1 Tax=Kordiimonas sp. TaxID=1970157 RepID=UPI003A9142D1
MRIAIMIAALGIVTAAPMFAPTTLLPQAEAQTADAASALEAELLAAAGDATAIQAIITREQGAGNSAGLARALARAATTLAATDVTGAADLVSQAVNIAQAAGDSTVSSEVGAAASTVASTAVARGDSELATAISQQIATNSSVEIASSYVNSGGTGGSVVPQGGATDTGGETSPVFTPTRDNTTLDRITPPKPPEEPVVPIVPEPNPSQAGSPV